MHLFFYLLCVSPFVSLGYSQNEFPAPLRKENFKAVTASGLHLVEFFSPYCSHCKSFAPVWQKTWEDFSSEGATLGIKMAQVDCVESGDLCNEEKIAVYPSLKLYGPQGFIRNFPKSYRRTEENIIKFCKEQAKEHLSDESLNTFQSHLVSTNAMLELLAGPIDKPYIISFWPTSDLQDLNAIGDTFLQTPYQEEIVEALRIWKIVSNQFPSHFEVGHFNCLANSKICQSLGVITSTGPQIGLVLPGLSSAKFVIYDQSVHGLDAKSIFGFAERVLEISQVPLVDTKGLIESRFIQPTLPSINSLTQASETFFVYLFDEETVSSEDFELLPYLIDPLASLPHTHLLKSKDPQILDLIELQKKNIYKAINYNESEPVREFSEQRAMIEYSTSLPALVCFKQNSINSEVFHSLAPNYIRDQFRVIDWIKLNSQQHIGELNQQSLPLILKEIANNRLLIIQLLNSTDEYDSLKHINNLNLALADYSDLDSQNIYEKIVQARSLKNNAIEKLKSQRNVKSKAIIDALSQEILYDEKEHFTSVYLDIAANLDILGDLGVRSDREGYRNGDVIVISGSHYFETDTFGENLSTRESPYFVREALSVFTKLHGGSLKRRLRNSPFGPGLSWLDNIHEYGLIGYVLALMSSVSLLRILSRLLRRNLSPHRGDTRGRGILDDPSKFD